MESAVVDAIHKSIKSIVELGAVSNDALAEDKDGKLVNKKLHGFINTVRNIVETTSKQPDRQIPIDILQYIDDGRNPDIYSREFIELIAKQNQSIAGTCGALNTFEKMLLEEAEKQQL